MRYLLPVCLCAVLFSAPALACRGTAEYSQVKMKLATADLPAAEKASYGKRLEDGWALHQNGHHEKNKALRKQSLKILDEIKAKIGM